LNADQRPGPGGADQIGRNADRYDRSARLRRRAWVKLDRFEWAKIRRRYRLRAHDLLLLFALAFLCDYENGVYSGTISDLAQDTGATWRAIDGALKRLHERDLIRIINQFGRNQRGEVQVLVLEQLLVDAKPVLEIPAQTRRPHLKAASAQQPRHSRAIPAQQPRIGTNPNVLTSTNATAPREQRSEGVRSTTVSNNNVSDAVGLLKRELNAQEVHT
jgi:hypothetical protein